MRLGARSVPARTLARVGLTLISLAAFLLLLGPVRRIAQAGGSRLGARIPCWFQRLLCAGLGVTVRAHGFPAAGAPRLIVANHVSWLDIPVLGSIAPMTFLAKKEVGDHRIGRELIALQGAVYVDRKRRSCIPAVNARMVETMRDGQPVVLFAEATTGDGLRLLRFRSSHFEAIRQAAKADNRRSAFVQPVFLVYSRLAGLPVRRAERPRLAWYGDMTFLPHLFAFAESGGTTCEVCFGPPIRVLPSMDRKTIARRTEAAVRQLAAAARRGRIGAGEETFRTDSRSVAE